MVTILYFAALREIIGTGEERIALPAEVTTLGDLADHLAARGGAYARALGDRSRLRAAVDLELADFTADIRQAREIAFFPPVTGG